MKNIIILFGGRSCEHDISIITAMQVLNAADKTKFKIYPIYITQNGEWFLAENLNQPQDFINFNPNKFKQVFLGPASTFLHVKTLFGAKKIANINCAILCNHGVNGEEWYASLSAHLEVFSALGFENVKYAHNPVICKLDADGNKRKISKRLDPEADMKYFTISGYPKEAILEYLLTLANSNFEIWRAENPSLPMTEFKFSANKISSSNPIFDFNKLKDISKTIIANKTAEEIVADLKNWKINLEKHSPEDENLKLVNVFLKNENYFKNVINIDRGGPKPRKDIAKWEDIFEVFGYMFEEFFYWVEYETQEYSDEKLGHLVEVLTAYKTVFDDADERETWFEKIKNMSQNLGFATNNKEFKQNPQNFKGTVADVCEYIRIALTGKRQSPDLYSIMKVLGNEEILARIEKCLRKIEKN